MPIQNHFGEAHSHLGFKSSIFLEKELPSPPSYEATRNLPESECFMEKSAPNSIPDEYPLLKNSQPHLSNPTTQEDTKRYSENLGVFRNSQPAKYVTWGVNWVAPGRMVGLMFGGLAFATGHHVFYTSLDGKEVTTGRGNDIWDFTTQEWMIGYGTAFAFLAKTAMAAAVAFAYKEHIWTTMKKKPVSIAGLDAAFSAIDDIFFIFKKEFLCKFKVASVLALCTWLLPISALITPATLSVVPLSKVNEVNGSVPILDLSLYGPTFSETKSETGHATPGLTRITVATASQFQILSMPAVKPNSSYDMTFRGPSFRCQKPKSDYITTIIDQMYTASASADFCEQGNSPLQSLGNQVQAQQAPMYVAFVPTNYTAGLPDASQEVPTPQPFKASVYFRTCDESCTIRNQNQTPETSNEFVCGNMPTNDALWIRSRDERFVCTLEETSYNITYETSGQVQNVRQPFQWEWISGMESEFGTIRSNRSRTYGYIVDPLIRLVKGSISGEFLSLTSAANLNTCPLINRNPENRNCSKYNLVMRDTRLAYQTSLIGALDIDTAYTLLSKNAKPFTRNLNIGELIEELSRNVTLSLLSDASFWSKNSYPTAIRTTNQINIYSYNARNLILTYSIAFCVCFCSVIIGLSAYRENGVSHSTLFSGILTSTRNLTLDKLTLGSSLAADPLSEEIKGTKLLFGVLHKVNRGEGEKYARLGFGIEGEVNGLVKGAMYQ